MRKTGLILVTFCASVLTAACGNNKTPDMAGPADMAMTGGGMDMTTTGQSDMAVTAVIVGPGGGNTFSPATITIGVGGTVKWTWQGSGHNVVSGTGGTADNKFCSPADQTCGTAALSNTGDTYSHTFTTAGSYPYFCKPHVGAGMTGTITVQ